MYIVWRSYWAYALRQQSGILGYATDASAAYAMARAIAKLDPHNDPHVSRA